ncbi:MAG: dienelactone hydrolase family protein [Chloroflexi bacterium]|nr:dienelactone hydrolase family protein [Chloroflexota bacterium]
MCFDTDSRPPIAPIAGGALDAGRITLTSEDGTDFDAFRATPAKPTGAGILILPDIRGLHAYYEELALRYAENGIDAIAIDYFARTAGRGDRGDGFDYAPHVPQTTWEALAGDIRAGIAALRATDGADRAPTSLFTTGFCMGGRLAFLSATLTLGLAGAIGFYGWPTGPSRNGTPAPADLAPMIGCPLLEIWGGADQGISSSVVDEFDRALDAAGVEHRSITYPGAPHSFFDKKADQFADASAAAWTETLAFIREQSVRGAGA